MKVSEDRVERASKRVTVRKSEKKESVQSSKGISER